MLRFPFPVASQYYVGPRRQLKAMQSSSPFDVRVSILGKIEKKVYITQLSQVPYSVSRFGQR